MKLTNKREIEMRNEQKAELRKIIKELDALKERANVVMTDLDEYFREHEDKLRGSERGEKLTHEYDCLYEIQEGFEHLSSEILDVI